MSTESKSDDEFSHRFTKEVELSKALDPMIVVKLLSSPYFWRRLYHGMINFYKADDTLFAADEYLSQSDEFKLDILSTPGDKATYSITHLQLNDPKVKSFTIRSINLGSSKSLSLVQTTITYDLTDTCPKISLTYRCKAKNSTPYNLMKMATDQLFKRVVMLTRNQEQALKELDLIGSIKFNYSRELEFYHLPYGIITEVFVKKDLKTVENCLISPNYLKKIFPDSSDFLFKKESSICVDDSFKIKMNNMKLESFQLVSTVDVVTFFVKESKGELKLLSETGVTNLHQLGYEISLKSVSDQMTCIRVGVYYHLSTLLSVASKIQKLSSLFNIKIPDPADFMIIRVRSLMDTSIRHLSQYIQEHLKEDIASSSDELKRIGFEKSL